MAEGITSVRTDLGQVNTTVRSEHSKDIASLRTEFTENVTSLRTELVSLKSNMHSFKNVNTALLINNYMLIWFFTECFCNVFMQGDIVKVSNF